MIKFSYMFWLMGRWRQVNLSCLFDSAVTECLITKWVFRTYFLGQTTHFLSACSLRALMPLAFTDSNPHNPAC